ncbi:IRK-interacting protein-like [Coffea arabica]|uniref:IRK-interacting protein-like n=1 Tax=Coffea arabica TaxID=13443 RepID=A0A6P6TTN9_COFAR|nr:IRK-interacting protein-like [Coffea arabica]XP_027081780.1 IRK-interacting protein-like [Coffea arabica]XP_027081781.1 IRK-interacting protein-like [Coffea arabica]XP_027081782.1 IRK-interacting protein-like [Coffea arabica]
MKETMNNPMATSSSSRPSISPHHPPQFTPIEEGNEDEELSRSSFRATTPSDSTDPRHHNPTPLHQNSSEKRSKEKSTRKKLENGEVAGEDDRGISCNKCRPGTREKISVVPVDNNGVNRQSLTSPNGIFRSIFSNLIKKSPRSSDDQGLAVPGEEQWKVAAAELSHKLIQATRKRDEAILEASRLKYSMAELEKKLNKLEIYCHNLKSGLEVCAGNNNANAHQQLQANKCSNSKPQVNYQLVKVGHDQGKVIEHFLVSVSEARSSIRLLSRSLTLQLRQMGNKVYDRISSLLQHYEVKISISRNPRGLLLYLEALLNRAFFEDFESIGFQKSAPNLILNPIDSCESNFASFNRLQGLTWDEVLNRGTKHFSEDFSRFCDRKMSEIVAMLGWNRAWPEQLLQSFFGASKAVWLVHLLAHSVHPSLPIFRVDKGATFDSIYMEDMGGEKAQKLVPTIVRIMVTPGFYVYDNVVKCKVLCRYYNSNNGYNIDSSGKVLVPSPS